MRNTCSGHFGGLSCLQILLTAAVVFVSYNVGSVSCNSYPPPPPYIYSSPQVKCPPHNFTSPAMTGSKTVLANETATYCVAKDGADEKMLQASLDWVCAKVDCSPLLEGQACYEPNTVAAHASYAFNAYYQMSGKLTGTCDFKGTGNITTTNPSHDACIFHYRPTDSISPAWSFQFSCFRAVIFMSSISLLF